MKKLFILASLFTVQAQAAYWVELSSNRDDTSSQMVFDVDATSIQYRDGLVQAWLRFSTNKPTKLLSPPYSAYKSYLSLTHFDCKLSESTASQTTYYSEEVGGGEILYTDSIKRSFIKDRMTPAIPGTLGEANLKKVCAMAGAKK